MIKLQFSLQAGNMGSAHAPTKTNKKKKQTQKRKLRKQQQQHYKKTHNPPPPWILLKYLISYVYNDYFLKKPNKTTHH